MITWAEKVAFVGMTVKVMLSNACYRYKIKLSCNPGRCSYGCGDTLEKAIESAAWGMSIDWWSVERKITELEWKQMSHT